MKDSTVYVRLPENLLKHLDNYCSRNFIDRSSAIRMAIANWEPIRQAIEEDDLKTVPELVVDFKPKDQKKRRGRFFIISGPSGVGKNTLLTYALQKVSGVYYLPSITTRPMRKGECQGNPYYFVTKAQFLRMIETGSFLEWKQLHSGDYYGTHLPTILYAIENGYDIVTDMDVLGCQDVVERFAVDTVTIFIAPPSLDELAARLARRESDPKVIEKRLERVEMEMAYRDKYQHVILNDKLETAGQELAAILKNYA